MNKYRIVLTVSATYETTVEAESMYVAVARASREAELDSIEDTLNQVTEYQGITDVKVYEVEGAAHA